MIEFFVRFGIAFIASSLILNTIIAASLGRPEAIFGNTEMSDLGRIVTMVIRIMVIVALLIAAFTWGPQ